MMEQAGTDEELFSFVEQLEMHSSRFKLQHTWFLKYHHTISEINLSRLTH